MAGSRLRVFDRWSLLAALFLVAAPPAAMAAADVTDLSAGGYHSAALTSVGSVAAWGRNDAGQTTVPPAATSGVVAVAAGGHHTVALKSDGSVIAWGDNGNGQATAPAGAATGVIAIAAGSYHSVALKGGSVIAWGLNNSGQTTIPAAAASDVAAIAAGAYHSVALKDDGSVVAWGANNYGQTTIPAAAASGVAAIAAGAYHSVALKDDGSVVAWGQGNYGQSAVPPAAAFGVAAIAAGARHTVALKDDGSVIAWGDSGDGQTNVPAAAATGVAAIAAGWYHTLALKADGTVIAWGRNDFGQSSPYFTVSADPWGALHAGDTIGITSDEGGIACFWDGASTSGACASGAIFAATSVVLTATLPPDTLVDFWGAGCDAETATTCTIDRLEADTTIAPLLVIDAVLPGAPEIGTATAGDARAAVSFTAPAFNGGSRIRSYTVTSSGGQTGTGPSSPVTVAGLTNGTAYTFTVAATNAVGTGPSSGVSGAATPLAATNAILSSSSNPSLAGATVRFAVTVTGASPTGAVTFMDGAAVLATVDLSGGRAAFTAADLSAGLHAITAVYGGDPANSPSTSPPLSQTVSTNSGVIALAAGYAHAVALKSDGSVVAWGLDTMGQATVPAFAGSGIAAVAAGHDHTVALKDDGSVVAWGDDGLGQATAPAAADSEVAAVAAGWYHTVALKDDGSVVAWGHNGFGQSATPAFAASGVIAVAAGGFHTVALKGDGSVVAWGVNNYGQSTVPAAAASGVVAIAAGLYHTVALRGDGSVVGWGYGFFGQTTPPAAAAFGVVAIAAGEHHSVALKGDGSVIAWGLNGDGQTTIPAAAVSGVIAIAAGGRYTAALKSAGSVITWGRNTDGQCTVPYHRVTIEASGWVADGQTVTIAADAGGIACAWDGTTPSVTCESGAIIETTRVVLTASLPPNTIVDSWGAGCDATTATTCTIDSLATGTTVTLTTLAAPGRPADASAAPGNAQAVVSFTAPVSDGGSAITSYTVTASGGQTGSGPTSPITVAGLANGTAYTFTVTATNLIGTGVPSEASNSVTPRTVPDAPTIGTAVAGDGEASVSFTAPAWDGGNAITSYTVTSSGGQTGSGPTSPITVAGLANGTAYTFTVSATNVAGMGEASEASNSVTPRTVPDAPTIGTAVAGDGDASVSFTAPAWDGGSAITSYTVTSSGGQTGSGPTSPITVAGLTNGTAYTFTASATNAAGTGAASGASESVTPRNTPPTLDALGDVTMDEDAGEQTVSLSGITAGTGAPQTLTVTATSSDTMLIPAPAVSYDSPAATGSLVFASATNAHGTATITVTVDDGQTENSSATRTFTVVVNAVNDAPTFVKGGDQTVPEDAGEQIVPAWATGISAGPADESGQELAFSLTNDNSELFAVQPALAADGTLRYTPAENANGVAGVTVRLHDDGGAAGAGEDTSGPQTFTITITSVIDVITVGPGDDIGAGVDLAGPGDVVLIPPGTWYVNLDIATSKDVTLRGGGETSRMTVLNGDTDPALPGGDGSVLRVTAADGIRSRVRLENLTITSGAAPCGGGLHFDASGGSLSAELSQVIVRLNSAGGGAGGGICARAAGGGTLELSLENVMVTENAAERGGGIYALADGTDSRLALFLMNDTVGGNSSAGGGGAELSAANDGQLSATVVNSILAGNTAGDGADVRLEETGGGRVAVDASHSLIRVTAADSGTLGWGEGMRTGTPVFRNPIKGDFHLNSDSPCIDRGAGPGAPLLDFEGNLRPPGLADIGADEYTGSLYGPLTLITLRGRESIPGGRPFDITWKAPKKMAKFKLYYSPDNGATWKYLGMRRKRHFTWNVPIPRKTTATHRVKLEGYSRSGVLLKTVKSPKPFTIKK